MVLHRLSLPVVLVSLIVCGCGDNEKSVFAAHAAPNVPHLDAAALRTDLTAFYKASGARAMIATVRQGDQEIVSLALGDSMTDVPASLEDHLRMGGVSETYFGTIVMLLVEQGVFSLDDKISKWLPDLLAADQVTVGMLMTNQGGYKDYVYEQAFTDAILEDPFRPFTRDEIIAYAVAGGEMNFPPGTSSRYSHTEFTILGKVIEKASGKTMEQLHQELLFQPLGLVETGYAKDARLPEPVLHAFSSDRKVYEDATFWNPTWTGDSGPLYSTVGEIARWVRVHGRGELLTPESFARLSQRPASATDERGYFASGFVVSNGWFLQNPSFNGYSGAYGYLGSQDITIVVYTTESRDPTTAGAAYPVLKKVVEKVSPDQRILF